MTRKIWIATWKGEGERDFGVLGNPSQQELEVYETIAKDILIGVRELEEETFEFEEAVKYLAAELLGNYEIDGSNHGCNCDYNVESFEMELK